MEINFRLDFAENNLTTKLADIIKWNQKYKKSIQTSKELTNVDIYDKCAQYHIFTYYDNDIKDLPKSVMKCSGSQLASISTRYKGGKKVVSEIRY